MMNVIHFFIDFADQDDEVFQAFWAALLVYYGPVLPPLTVFEPGIGISIVTEHMKNQLRQWQQTMGDTGRVIAEPLFAQIKECLFLEIPHLSHRDHLFLHATMLELFFRFSPEDDMVQQSQEIHHWFFRPLLEDLGRRAITLDNFPLQITYADEKRTLCTSEIADLGNSFFLAH